MGDWKAEAANVLAAFTSWVSDVGITLAGGPFSCPPADWPKEFVADIPQQNNSNDCGVFAIQVHECLALCSVPSSSMCLRNSQSPLSTSPHPQMLLARPLHSSQISTSAVDMPEQKNSPPSGFMFVMRFLYLCDLCWRVCSSWTLVPIGLKHCYQRHHPLLDLPPFPGAEKDRL